MQLPRPGLDPATYRSSLKYCWSNGYGARLLTHRSRDQILAAAAAFSMEAKMVESRVLRFRCTLKNSRWSKFPKHSTTASLIIISWFWVVKPQQLLLLLKYCCHVRQADFFFQTLHIFYKKFPQQSRSSRTLVQGGNILPQLKLR